MIVVMKERATETEVDSVIARLIELGMDVHRSSGATRTVLGVVGAGKVEKETIEILDVPSGCQIKQSTNTLEVRKVNGRDIIRVDA